MGQNQQKEFEESETPLPITRNGKTRPVRDVDTKTLIKLGITREECPRESLRESDPDGVMKPLELQDE